MSSPNRYVPGFRLLNQNQYKKRKYPVGIAVAVAFGDAMIITAGWAVLGTTLQQVTPVFIGIANSENTAAEAVANGTVNVEIIPADYNFDFMVPVEATALIARADVGILVDLQTEDGIDEADVVTAGKGFFVDDIDVSSAAVAANTFGYAIGHFEDMFAS